MRSSVLSRLPDARGHSPCRPAASAVAPRCKLSCYVTHSTCTASRSSSTASTKILRNDLICKRNDLASTDSSNRGRDVSRHAAKKEPNMPDSEQLLKAGLDIAKTVAAADPRVQALSALAGKYMGTDVLATANQQPGPVLSSAPNNTSQYQRITLLALLLVNMATFVLANDIAPAFFSSLPLNHWKTGWWQFVTSAFCSTSWQQLSMVTFMVAAFGSNLVARHGAWSAWGAYTLGAAGTNLFWYWLLPHKIGRVALASTSSLYGAFALFLAASFLQVGGFWWWLLEFVLLGQFLVWLLVKDGAVAALPTATIGGAKVPAAMVGILGCLAGVGLYFGLRYCFAKFAQWAKKHSKE